MRFNYIGDLPEGYEYKIFQTDNDVKIMGVHPEKEPIGFVISGDLKLSPLKMIPNENIG